MQTQCQPETGGISTHRHLFSEKKTAKTPSTIVVARKTHVTLGSTPKSRKKWSTVVNFHQLQPRSASSAPASQRHRAARPDGPRPGAAHRGLRHAPPTRPAAEEAAAEWPGCYKGWKRRELLQGPLDEQFEDVEDVEVQKLCFKL